MAMNDLSIEQISTVLNAVLAQAQGTQGTLQTVNTKDLITVAQTALKTGYDPILNAVSQVLSRTIFSTRPYNRKFDGLFVSNERYGNHVRKLQMVDSGFENDDRLTLTDGQSVDMYTVKKPVVLQTNFYGEQTYQKHITIFRDQLDTAFSSLAQFGSFISMVLTNISNEIAQADEELARTALTNMIGGKITGDTASVIHLVTEYNAYAGTSYDSDTIKDPTAYEPFVKWVFGRIKTLGQRMGERTQKFHNNVTNYPIMRHTPSDRMKVYLYAPVLNDISASVLSDVYNNDLLKFADHESVSYWQNFDNPDSIKVDATYMKADGTLDHATVTKANVFGMMFDDEAIGITRVNTWTGNTPFNVRGGYYNIYYHFTNRYWNDFTENCVVLLLD